MFGVLVEVITVGILKVQDGLSQGRNIYFNEIIIVTTMYSFLCFTDFVPNVQTQEIVGYAACSTVSAHLVFNIFFMVKASVHQAILKLKRRTARKNRRLEGKKKVVNLTQETL